MMESLLLLSNEVALTGSFGSNVVSREVGLLQIQKSSWKVISHYQQPPDTSRGHSFPAVIGIKLEHQFGEFADTGVINCRLIDEGDVLKDVFEDYNLLVTEARPAVFIRLPETELVFTDLKVVNTDGDIEFQSRDQAVGKMLTNVLLASTPEKIRTTVTIRIPISPPCSTITQSEPQSVYDEVFENPLIMDRIMTYVVGINVDRGKARTRDIKCVTAVNKCWRASLCRVLELNGGHFRAIHLDRLNSTVESFSGGFPLHNVTPYALEITVGNNEELSGRVLRFLGRYPATVLKCYYFNDAPVQTEKLHHILQFRRLKSFSVTCTRPNRDILQDIQRMLKNFPILERFDITCELSNWIPSQDEGLILPESLKFLELVNPSRSMTVVSDQNQFKNVKHFILDGEDEADDEDLEVEEEAVADDENLEDEEEDEADNEDLEVEEEGEADNEDLEVEEEDEADDEQLEVEVDENVDRPDGNHGLHHGDRNNLRAMQKIETRICTMLKSMGPSLVSLGLSLNASPLKDLRLSLPDLPKLNSLVVSSVHIDYPTNLPSLEIIRLQQGSMKFLSALFIEDRQFGRVTECAIVDVIEAAFVAKIAAALPNCTKLTVAIRDDLKIHDGKYWNLGAAALGEICSRLPRLLVLEITCFTKDKQFLDLVFTGRCIHVITRLKQTDEYLDYVLGPRSITNLNCLQTLVIRMGYDLEIEVSDFLFRIAFMKMDTLTTLVLGHGISAGAAIMQQWKTMGRRVGRGCGDYACLTDLV